MFTFVENLEFFRSVSSAGAAPCARGLLLEGTAVLEQLHDKVLRSVDPLAHAGARRPLATLEGWRDAAERTANKAPTSTVAVVPHSLPAPPTARSVGVAPAFDC